MAPKESVIQGWGMGSTKACTLGRAGLLQGDPKGLLVP